MSNSRAWTTDFIEQKGVHTLCSTPTCLGGWDILSHGPGPTTCPQPPLSTYLAHPRKAPRARNSRTKARDPSLLG